MIHPLLALTLLFDPGPDIQGQVAEACRAPVGSVPTVSGISVEHHARQADDLGYLRVTVGGSGAWLDVFFDEVSRDAARARAACLGGQIALLERELGDVRTNVHWDDVVFTSQRAYAPPRGAGVATRWSVYTSPAGEIDETGQRMVSLTLPHEQVHEYQSRAGAGLPRWFSEGHATWVGLKVTEAIDPRSAAEERSKHERDLDQGAKPLGLRTWGSVRPKREAILRQLTPEDRRRYESDPSYVPSGSFEFGPGDLIGDESNAAARYAGAWRIFVGLEARHGASQVSAWAAEIVGMQGAEARSAILGSARDRFGEDLSTGLD